MSYLHIHGCYDESDHLSDAVSELHGIKHKDTSGSWTENSLFIQEFERMAEQVQQNSKNHGFWPIEKDRNKPEMIALMHSELSEALEGYRKGNPPSDHIPEFNSLEEELADVVIRVMDFAHGFNLRVAEAIVAKHEFNKGRVDKHGKIC